MRWVAEGRRATRSCAAGALLLVGTGCAAGISTSVSEPVRPVTAVRVTRLAVMPVTTDVGSEGLRPELSAWLVEDLRQRIPEVVVIDPLEAARALAEGPAATDYAAVLADFERTGVAESARLERITRALDVSHFLHVRASYAREEFLDPRLFDEHELDREERQLLVAVARLWSADGPGPVWEAVAHTESQTSDFTTGRHMSELVADLTLTLLGRAPIVAAPPPQKP